MRGKCAKTLLWTCTRKGAVDCHALDSRLPWTKMVYSRLRWDNWRWRLLGMSNQSTGILSQSTDWETVDWPSQQSTVLKSTDLLECLGAKSVDWPRQISRLILVTVDCLSPNSRLSWAVFLFLPCMCLWRMYGDFWVNLWGNEPKNYMMRIIEMWWGIMW